jgi:hypothetical protein
LYETGQLPPLTPGKDLWIHDGKIVGLPKKVEKGSAVWLEVCLGFILYCYFAYSMLRELVSSKHKFRHRRWELAIAIAIVRTHCLTVTMDSSYANGTVNVLWTEWRMADA